MRLTPGPLKRRVHQATVIVCFCVIGWCLNQQATEIRQLRCERNDLAERVDLQESWNEAQRQTSLKDQAYIDWLEQRLRVRTEVHGPQGRE